MENIVNRLDVWEKTKKECCSDGIKGDIKVEESIKYFSKDVDNIEMIPKYTNTHVHVLDADTVDCAKDLAKKGYNPLLLNMSDIRTAGGAVERGSVAQEENLFRRSNYFRTLKQDFYPLDGISVIYSPKVCFYKENEEKQYQLSSEDTFIDCLAAPAIRNPSIALDSNSEYKYQNKEERELMKEKARMIFKIGYLHSHDVLVLSAHGCGAWGGPTHEIAKIYKELIDEYKGCFYGIVFAILNSKMLAGLPVSNYNIFKKILHLK